jgi:hypothetical protein
MRDMSNTFNTRQEIINALVAEFNANSNNFDYNKTAVKFWTFNRLFHYYWDLKMGRKCTYLTEFNPTTGYYQLKVA